MATMNVSLPDGLKDFVELQVGERGYGTSSEYVRDLIRRDQARTQVRGFIVDGMTSGPGPDLDSQYFDGLRSRIRGSEADIA
ncbi:ribbon-helix-helix domain-containing protein [Labedella endophytica]|uniref:Type II toxin-antitoxin system ParD family antitoxin n=1 Tax=Labedella endophytica TaxID=1523160 RepID=A0A433JTQ4_9MICO|nr:type II toxin-antitoxin system ParD family antitoxin [Labedella endophytica]RUR01723.1 type II toxin-antitoxin system ParD family antitoxin [Labedella endophytica]